ncbi:MAG: polyhydroxyalkanoate granule-associated phasin [Gammaproteobacteria bacterium]
MRHTRRRKGGTGLGWWQPWMQLWEIAVAAPQVVAHRTARMARSGPTRSSADRKELTRMTQEKFEAFGESASAMAAEIVRANVALWPSVLRAGGTLPSAMWMPTARAGSRGFASKPALAAGAVPRIVSGAASRVLAKGFAPVHRRATANAKRLRRTPR